MDKKNIIFLSIAIIGAIALLTASKFIITIYDKAVEEERIRNAIIEVELADDLTASFNTKKKVSEYITSINGEIVDDYEIDTTKLGTKEVKFEFINEEDIKVPYSYEIEVKDVTAPFVWLSGDYYVTKGFAGSLESRIICTDDYDDEPLCKVEGNFNPNVVGNYPLNFHAKDSEGNETNIPFTLHVNAPTQAKPYVPNPDDFEEMKKILKNENTALGIDVSSWQGNINFERVKNAGVEFAFVRVGSKWSRDGEYFLDATFERNMEGFNEVGIPVGAYFYSYARNEQEAIEEAEWLIDKIEGYKVDLPIAFDFEDWSNYNDYKMSLYRLNRNAEVFIETLEKAGYKGMLYGSVSYMNKMWDTEDKILWGAHYTTKANYKDVFDYWQFSSEGIVDGIAGYVDLNVMYKS